jgi:uncharacterized protein YdbL (DUF1318 family)
MHWSPGETRLFTLGFSSLPFLVALGCITVNVYFPETELQEAAAEIVNDARPDAVSPTGLPETQSGSNEPAGRSTGSGENEVHDKKAFLWRSQADGLLSLFRPRLAHAEEEKKAGEKESKEKKAIKLEISTPVIDRIRETLKKRYAKLLPFYEKGAIGEGKDGYVARRETEKLGLKEKRDIQLYVDEENKDRKNLYTELARENNIEVSKIGDIAALFGAEWQKKSKPGWWIETEKGKWEKKRQEKREDKQQKEARP